MVRAVGFADAQLVTRAGGHHRERQVAAVDVEELLQRITVLRKDIDEIGVDIERCVHRVQHLIGALDAHAAGGTEALSLCEELLDEAADLVGMQDLLGALVKLPAALEDVLVEVIAHAQHGVQRLLAHAAASRLVKIAIEELRAVRHRGDALHARFIEEAVQDGAGEHEIVVIEGRVREDGREADLIGHGARGVSSTDRVVDALMEEPVLHAAALRLQMLDGVDAAPAVYLLSEAEDLLFGVLPAFRDMDREERELVGERQRADRVLHRVVVVGVEHREQHEGELDTLAAFRRHEQICSQCKQPVCIDLFRMVVRPLKKRGFERKHAVARGRREIRLDGRLDALGVAHGGRAQQISERRRVGLLGRSVEQRDAVQRTIDELHIGECAVRVA